MRTLVTGGAGYIGSVVVEELLAAGQYTVVYDNLSLGHREAVLPGAEFVQGEILDRRALENALTKHKIDAVIHMASNSLVGESSGNPAKYYTNNLVTSLALLEAMRATGVSRLVLSSTAAVYGESQKPLIDESDATRPTNPYGETKLAFERACHWYEQAYGMRYVSLRYFNAAGATKHCGELHDPETHLIPLVLQAAAKHAQRQGARIIEGYPVEPKKGNMPDVFAYTGLSSAFHQAGFVEVLRRSATRPIMRHFC